MSIVQPDMDAYSFIDKPDESEKGWDSSTQRDIDRGKLFARPPEALVAPAEAKALGVEATDAAARIVVPPRLETLPPPTGAPANHLPPPLPLNRELPPEKVA